MNEQTTPILSYKRVSNHQAIILGNRLGRGGEASVYEVEGDNQIVVKIYHENRGVPYKKIESMIANPPDLRPSKDNHISLSWPIDLVEDQSGKAVGYIMPKVTGGLPLYVLYSLSDRKEISDLTWSDLHRVAYNISIVLTALHQKGYLVGDLNESNILVYQAGLVTFIDVDSFQVPDVKGGNPFRCEVGKLTYFAPELQGRDSTNMPPRDKTHDYFALAVMIFQLLQEGRHPFTGLGDPPELEKRIALDLFPHKRSSSLSLNLSGSKGIKIPTWALPFEVLSIDLQDLFIRAFDEGFNNPHQRPSPADWIYVLNEAINELVVCHKNENHLYYQQSTSNCPWCERKKLLGEVDSFPATLHPIAMGEPQYQPFLEWQEGTQNNNQSAVVASSSTPTLPDWAVRLTLIYEGWQSRWTSFSLASGSLIAFFIIPLVYIVLSPLTICLSKNMLNSIIFDNFPIYLSFFWAFLSTIIFLFSLLGFAVMALPLQLIKVSLETLNIFFTEDSFWAEIFQVAEKFLYHCPSLP